MDRGPQGLRRPRFSFSDSLVKQPRTNPVPPSCNGGPSNPKSSKLTASDGNRKLGHRISVRSFEDTPSRRGVGEPNAGLYRRCKPQKSTPARAEIQRCRCALATLIFVSNIERLDRVQRGLTPHSSHIPRPLLAWEWEVSLSGELAPTIAQPRETGASPRHANTPERAG